MFRPFIGIEAHYSRNFLPENDLQIGGSIVSEQNSARYAQYQPMIDKYGQDIGVIHNILALPRNVIDAVTDKARQVFTGRDPVEQAASLRQTGCAVPLAVDARNSSHPDHALYRQIDDGMRAVDASVGRAPDGLTERATASLFAEAKISGLGRADHVLVSNGAAANADGPKLFVVQGALNDPAHLHVQVSATEAAATPIEHSFERVAVHEKQHATQELQRAQRHEQAAPRVLM